MDIQPFNKTKKVFQITNGEQLCYIIQGDGRNIPEIPNAFVHAIITDHPWDDEKSNKGGNRHFDNSYGESSFRYTRDDFAEKYRVLKDGCFLVENLPEENYNNFDYLYEVKKMAQSVGFEYFAQVPWVKGSFISNTGRKSKNSEMLVFFTKGKARCLRFDQKKHLKTGKNEYMSGTKQMLPVSFNFQPAHVHQKKHKAEKPIELLENIIGYITNAGEIILDQFSGSLNIVKASLHNNRHCLAYELNEQFVLNNIKYIEDEFPVTFKEESHV